MRKFKNRHNIQKIIASIMLVVTVSFTIPKPVHADDDGFGGKLLKPLVQLVASLGDVAVGLMNHFMLGTENLIDSVMLSRKDNNVDEGSLSIQPGDKYVEKEVDEELTGFMWGEWKLPNMLYCPENIFANKIGALDVNFINPHKYNAVQKEGVSNQESIANSLQGVISAWYKSFRNIAIVGLLSVLIYIGIRILIGSTAQDKAKYKERLIDWLVALCLVFAMQYIMSATLMLSEKVTELFSNSGANSVVIKLTGKNRKSNYVLGTDGVNDYKFKTNLMGYMRFMAQSYKFGDATAYTIIYLALVMFTVKFTITYLKRVLYMAFFTMISPLVALTYPIDKIADGKAQAFTIWFKEYMMNAVLQPVHLILYTALVSSAMDLAVNNPVYALVAIGFMIPAEKFIKKMFRLDRGESTGGFGDFAAGALTMSGLKKLGSSPSKSKGSSSGSSKEGDAKIRTQEPYKDDKVKQMNAWRDGEQPIGQGDDNGSQGGSVPDFSRTNASRGEISSHRDSSQQAHVSEPDTVSNWFNQRDSMRTPSQTGREIRANLSNGMANFGRRTSQRASRAVSRVPGVKRIPSPVRKIMAGAGKTAIRGVKNGAKGVWKNKGKIARTGAKLAGGVMGAAIGMGAGLTTGDFSKVAQYATGGVAAGYATGNQVANLTGAGVNMAKKLPGKAGDVRNAFEEETYGLADARQKKIERHNTKAKKEWLKNESERAKYADIAAKLNAKSTNGKQYSVNEVMDAAWDYKVAGVDNEKNIEKGLKLEAKRHGAIGKENSNHNRVINVMQEVGNYSKEHFVDKDKREALDERLRAQLGNENGEKVMELMADANDELKTYQAWRNSQRTNQ